MIDRVINILSEQTLSALNTAIIKNTLYIKIYPILYFLCKMLFFFIVFKAIKCFSEAGDYGLLQLKRTIDKYFFLIY